ncbi:MAG: N-formylglutamate amidohydrolase [Polyangiales bacterium]|nr:N-formylglutamate amidohydrolase [Myxococcales bacterium]MCB9657411.1 N-formylglutamate amidohydrolase [Sandaracinaceae bacterium]
MSFFELVRPQGDPGPVVVEVPHAGLAVPEQVADELLAPKDALMRDADPWVDELFADAPQVGATLLCAKVSRYVVDLNRAATDVDPLSVLRGPRVPRPGGRGVIWRIATDGAPVLRRPLSAERYAKRIELFYTPYHTQLRLLLDETVARHGFAILLAGHSMPSMGRDVRGGPILTRADIVPGSLGRSSAAVSVIDAIDDHFRSAGFSVAHDAPYRGGHSTAHYGRPSEGVHAVQLELNRALYMDERDSRPKDQHFEALRASLRQLVARLGRLPRPTPSSNTG